nr:C25 family peptidase propeptide domain-containing protein [uncultured Desulfobacter sp.]
MKKIFLITITALSCYVLTVGLISCAQPAGPWIRLADQAGVKSGISPSLEKQSKHSSDGKEVVTIVYQIFSVLKTAQEIDGTTYDTLFVEGCSPWEEQGKPDVPVKSIYIEIPEGADWNFRFMDANCTDMKNINLMPVQPLPTDYIDGQAPAFIKDEISYASDAFFPAIPLLSLKIIKIRDKKMLEIRLAPIQFNPVLKKGLVWNKTKFQIIIYPQKK